MTRGMLLTSLLGLVVSAPLAGAQEGELQRLRCEVRTTHEEKDDRPRKHCEDDDDNPLAQLVADLFGPSLAWVGWRVLGSPFYLPAHAIGDDWQHTLYFARYPYLNDYPGYLLLSTGDAFAYRESLSEGLRRERWAGRLSLEGGSDFSGIDRLGGQLRIESNHRIGFLTNWNYYHEQRDAHSDQLTIGDIDLTCRFAQNEVASMYAGLGCRLLSDPCRTDAGVNVTYGGDWFPMRPLVVSGALDVGNLGNAGVVHARMTLGAVFHGWELYAGYDFLRVGDVNLQGPLAGVRFWF